MFNVTQIHQIEMTSHCNLRCRYCAHPTMHRAKMHMTRETFDKALAWVAHFSERGTQGDLNLAGIGESTMHPQFVEFVHAARRALHPSRSLVLATNGILMTDELAQAIASTGIRVYVSAHRPERAGPAVEVLKRAGIIAGISVDPTISATDWAGTVKWHVSAQRSQCPWVRGGWAFVMSDGRLTRCAFDSTGVGVFGHVDDDVPALQTSPYALCRACHQDVGVVLEEVDDGRQIDLSQTARVAGA